MPFRCFLLVVGLWLMFVLPACEIGQGKIFKKLPASYTGIHFANTITETDSVNMLTYYYCYNGGGVGIADFNNDTLPDIFFTGNMVSSKLYLNKGNLKFEDITTAAGLSTKDWIMGVSIVDINSDGYMDIYLNVAGPAFGQKHANKLFINNKNLSFTEEAAAYGLNDSSFCVQSAFFDYDRDGDLDMYLLTNDVDQIPKSSIIPASFSATNGKTIDKLYENVGDSLGHPYYKNSTEKARISGEGYGLGLAVCDLNADGWPDVYAANDFMPNDQLLMNQRNGTFKDMAAGSMRHQTYNGMGVDIADINNDARPDIMVVDMLPENNERRKTMIAKADYESFALRKKAGYIPEYMRNTLQLNQGANAEGQPFFSDIAQLAGVNATDWSWGTLLADFDNDGFKDTYITNGFVKDITDLDFISYNETNNMFGTNDARARRSKEFMSKLKGVKLSNYLFRNNGNLQFENQTAAWGLKYDSYSNGAAFADLDNDGDLDLVTNNINEEAFLFENKVSNTSKASNYLQVELQGESLNKQGIGTSVILFCGGTKLHGYFSPIKGYLSCTMTPMHWGLGNYTIVDSLQVVWPDGKSQILQSIAANQRITLRHVDAVLPGSAISTTTWFVNMTKQLKLQWKHIENDYNDFINEVLLPGMHSRNGPGIAVGDVDKNNETDFFVGGSAGNPGTFFLQKKGQFYPKILGGPDSLYEDMGALCFDADQDGDADLYVVSGGSELASFEDRLYLNNGSGIFSKAVHHLPKTESSGSCVVAADFDKDGDLDLFRAGGLVPTSWPLSPQSYLLRNTGGRFDDVTNALAPGLRHVGMVKSAVWSDFDSDGWLDLIVVGEWMAPVFFKNKNGHLVDVSSQTGLKHLNGWWNSIYPFDFDNDGDTDYALGNMGENIDYRPSADYPMELYYGTFGVARNHKPIITHYITDNSGRKKTYPFAFRDDLFASMPTLKQRFQTYAAYSKADLNALFGKSSVQKAKHFKAETFKSCVLENKGGGKFGLRELPVEAQMSCVFGILAEDINADGYLDLLFSGNSHSNEAVFGAMDASLGLLLFGDGKGNFSPVANTESGLFLCNASRSLGLIYSSTQRPLIISPTNADSLQVLSPSKGGRVIFPTLGDQYAVLHLKNGKRRKQEFYCGSGYMAQQQAAIQLTDGIGHVELVDRFGKSRKAKITAR